MVSVVLDKIMQMDKIIEQLALFYISYYRLSYRAEDKVYFSSFKGGVFRGGLGSVLREKACLLPETQCSECNLKFRCSYSRLFETPISTNHKYFQGQSYAPHPFIIEPPLEDKDVYQPGEIIDFKLILVGSSVEYLPYFIYAFHQLGEKGIGQIVEGSRGKCTLTRADSLGNISGDAYSTLYLKDKASYAEPSVLMYLDAVMKRLGEVPGGENRIKVRFITPTRVQVDGEIVKTIEFRDFIKNLLRRISSLCYFYCGYEPDLDYKQLLDKAAEIKTVRDNLRWVDWKWYSGRQNKKLKLGGFKGDIVFQGDIAAFLPFILLGEYIHLGKATAYGLGQYRIT